MGLSATTSVILLSSKACSKRLPTGCAGGRDNISAVVVNPKEKTAAEGAVKELGLNAPVETDEKVRGGVRLRAKEGHVSLENTPPRTFGISARRSSERCVAAALL